ncbi:structural protein [Cellulophaga phage phi19:1]|uniref:Structural protein n=1 Tax=Cellulophaga phage phi19:1 TaxID=1327970 RepID=R9ZWA3_9CAUD|nr:structural protein [Cellulophaga phage phi19:1]AGO47381.1 structural protein [Cellulophaga phage phi19:1]
MIKVIDIIEAEFAKIPQIAGQDSLLFGYGDKREIDAVIIGNKHKKMYPLAWYLIPNEITHSATSAKGTFEFIIAHNSKIDYRNDQRFRLMYDTVLFPYLEAIITRFNRPSLIVPSDTYRITEYPNYSDSGKHSQIDCWDALKLVIDLEILGDNNC